MNRSKRNTSAPDTPSGQSGTVTLADLLADPAACRPPEPLIARLCWRGRLTLYASPDKSGKSTLLSAAAAAFTRGVPFLDGLTSGGTVLWLAGEEALGDLAQRAMRFGADPARFHVLAFPRDPRRDFLRAVGALRPDVAVVDPLIAFAGASVTDGANAHQWRAVMYNLLRAAREYGVGVIALHHTGRRSGQSRDSGDITAAADVVLEQKARPTRGGVQVIAARARWPVADFAVRLAGDAYSLVGATTTTSDRVLAHITEHPGCSQAQLRRGVGGKDAETDLAVQTLERSGAIVDGGTGQAHHYRLAGPRLELAQ